MKPASFCSVSKVRLIAPGVVLALVGRASAESPTLVEWHRSAVFPGLAAALQRMSGSALPTLGEAGALLLIVLVAAGLILMRRAVIGPLVFVAGLGVFAFYASWGLGYRYPPLSLRLSPAPPAADDLDSRARLVSLADQAAGLVTRASETALDLSGASAVLLARINAGLGAGFARLPPLVEAAPVRGVVFGPVKLSRVSFALTRLQLSGYYFPWTGEAQINAEMPRSLWPRVAAHEKAHQRGFAREDEATVIGLLACLASPDPAVFYGGALGLFVGLDREMAPGDGEERRRIWSGLPRRATDDLGREAAFWKAHSGITGVVSEKVNDTYLKAQGVAAGVGSYLETTRLILQAMETPGLEMGRLLESARSPTPEGSSGRPSFSPGQAKAAIVR